MVETQTESAFQLFDPQTDLRFEVRQVVPSAAGIELANVQFDESYRHAAEKKFHHLIIKASDLSAPGANILKQTCLTLGAEAGVHKGAINCKIDREAVLITATQAQLEKLTKKLRPQPFGLKLLSESITRMLQRQKYLQSQPIQMMAVLNITPDSFSDGGQLASLDAVLAQAGKALSHGAEILDIGGESTRPGAEEVSVEEELLRVIPVVQALHQRFPEAVMSIDTRKAAVAEAAIQAGASIINDVSGLTFDPTMLGVVAKSGCKTVIMHSQGMPETMQQNPEYEDVVGEVARFFYQQVGKCIQAGVKPENIILDPGFGFGKTVQHNLELMRRLPELVSIGFPVLSGTSRKSFLTLGGTLKVAVDEREALTAASLATAVSAGAKVLRVHDIETQGPVLAWLKALYCEPI